jgi:glycosyltransferase involved in cell wall biosynthesis
MLMNPLRRQGHLGESQTTQVVIAALNEEEGIGLTITEMMDVLDNPQVIVVDGKSTDRTSEIANNLGAIVARQNGVGKGDALAKALEYIEPQTEFVVITDADFTYPAESVPEMIRLLENNSEVGMVCGNRFNGKVDSEALRPVFALGNKLIAFVHNILNGSQLQDPLTGLRVVRASILRCWNVKSKGFDVEVELNQQVSRSGYGIVEIPIQYRQRLGEKKLGLKHSVEIFKRMVLESTQTM